MTLDGKVPGGPLPEKWERRKFENKLVNPANRRKYEVVIVGTGLAGASAAAALGEQGYRVKLFCILDSPRRAHSIAAQGGINAAKNYRNDGDSIYRLFYDTVKGGDYRAREANVYRLAQLSVDIIDQCVATGVPFAREYGGLLDNRSFGGAQVSRTFYARGQTGQQLLLGAYQSMLRQVDAGNVTLFPRREMLDLVVVDGQARGIVTRNLITGELERHEGQAVLLCTGGYGTVYYLSTNAINSNVTAAWRAHKRGALFANPCFTQIHPTCIPVSGDHQSKLTLMSESLRNDGRVWVPKKKGDTRPPDQIPEDERDYYLERRYRASATSCRATSPRARPRNEPTKGTALAKPGCRSISISRRPFSGSASRSSRRATATCSRCTSGSPARILQGSDAHLPRHPLHDGRPVGGLQPAKHHSGPLRDGRSELLRSRRQSAGCRAPLMQGLADGYFIAPYTVANYLAGATLPKVSTDHDAFKEAATNSQARIDRVLNVKGKRTVRQFHRDLGHIMWDYVGMARNEPGLKTAIEKIRALRDEFWKNAVVPGEKTI